MSLNVKIKLIEGGKTPQKASKNAAAFDLYARKIEFPSPDLAIVKLGFCLEFLPNYAFLISPRSSFTKTKWVMQNSTGIGDPDYRGEYMVVFRALPESVESFTQDGVNIQSTIVPAKFPYKVGERVAQARFVEQPEVTWHEVMNLNPSQRGEGGFGSTLNKAL